MLVLPHLTWPCDARYHWLDERPSHAVPRRWELVVMHFLMYMDQLRLCLLLRRRRHLCSMRAFEALYFYRSLDLFLNRFLL